ncbi:MAG: glutathione S-transferase family protein [Alphaproteobacteria bacterium]|nr:glutathione S-transferase family protein [Alphaproteobacteria bacterium]
MFTLYHHGSSVCAAKVRFAMAEKGLEWDGVYIDILKGDQFTPEYRKINPKSVVPTLVHDDLVIPESTVICEYLDHIEPDTSLHPTDPWEHAQVRYWTKSVDEELHPACGAITFACSHRHTIIGNMSKEELEEFLSSTPDQSVTVDWRAMKMMIVRQGFDAPGVKDKIKLNDTYLHKMEAALQDSDWLVGNRFTIADIALTPYVKRLAMMSLNGMWENGRLPNVDQWFGRIMGRPTFESALLKWVPEELTNQLRDNGAKSWPEVAEILEIG